MSQRYSLAIVYSNLENAELHRIGETLRMKCKLDEENSELVPLSVLVNKDWTESKNITLSAHFTAISTPDRKGWVDNKIHENLYLTCEFDRNYSDLVTVTIMISKELHESMKEERMKYIDPEFAKLLL